MRRHPLGLYILFLVEMWERFGFYCMAAVFALYMEDKLNGHAYLQRNHEQILGLYLGFVYFTPFFGGLIADRLIGYRMSVYIGGLVLAAGYFLLAFSPLISFFAGLTLVVIGNGLFKPNISTMVGKLYPPNDPRLDSAYTIFYMGINIGAFVSPLVAGILCTQFRRGDGFDGYHVAFAAAGVGMLISVLIFGLCRKWITGDDGPALSSRPAAGEEVPANIQFRRHLALLIIFAVVILFWMAFKQNAGKFNFWFRDHTIRTPAPWLYDLLGTLHLKGTLLDASGQFNKTVQSSINPFFVIAFSPFMVLLWSVLKARGWEPSTPAKVALGMLLTVGAFGIMTMGALASGETIRVDPQAGKAVIEAGRVSGGYLVGAYAVITLGELCLSPMGLSLVSKLAAPKWRSMWMGGWFVATAIGGYLSSGLIGEYWKDPWPPSTFFALLAGTSLVAFAITMATYPIVRRAMPAGKK